MFYKEERDLSLYTNSYMFSENNLGVFVIAGGSFTLRKREYKRCKTFMLGNKKIPRI